MTFVDDLFILGDAKVLFTNFINWLIRDCMRGFTLLAHNGAGFDSHYLFRYIRSDFGFHVEPLYQGSRLLQFLVKETRESRDYVLRGIDTVQFFQASLESLPKQFGLDGLNLKKGFFSVPF